MQGQTFLFILLLIVEKISNSKRRFKEKKAFFSEERFSSEKTLLPTVEN